MDQLYPQNQPQWPEKMVHHVFQEPRKSMFLLDHYGGKIPSQQCQDLGECFYEPGLGVWFFSVFGEISWGSNAQSPQNFRSFSNLSWSKPRTCKGYRWVDGYWNPRIHLPVTSHFVVTYGCLALKVELQEDIFTMLQPVLFTTASQQILHKKSVSLGPGWIFIILSWQQKRCSDVDGRTSMFYQVFVEHPAVLMGHEMIWNDMNLYSFSEIPQQKKDISIGFDDPAFIDFNLRNKPEVYQMDGRWWQNSLCFERKDPKLRHLWFAFLQFPGSKARCQWSWDFRGWVRSCSKSRHQGQEFWFLGWDFLLFFKSFPWH